MMEGFKQECKLCDNIITDGNFKVIGDGIKTIFDRLLLKLTSDCDTQNVICAMCYSKLLAALNFKTACVHTDDILSPYINLENGKPLDLKEIYAKQKDCKQGGSVLDDREVCRMCLHPTSNDHKSIEEVPVDNIQIYIPEINFAKTANPVICIKCHDALRAHSSFIKNCLEVEKKRSVVVMDVKDVLLTDPCIKTEEIEIKPEPSDDETLFKIPCDIKKGEEEGGSSSHPRNGLTDTVETENRSVVQMYQCDKCPYKNIKKRKVLRHKIKHKDHFNIHQSKHQDPSKAEMYECDRCDYRSISKRNLRSHQTRHKVRMYPCDKCGFRTAHTGSLCRHKRRHENYMEVRAFKCNECDYSSFWKGDLDRHQWTHRDSQEVQIYKSDQCDYKRIEKK